MREEPCNALEDRTFGEPYAYEADDSKSASAIAA